MIEASSEQAASRHGDASEKLRLWPAWFLTLAQAIALILTVTPSVQNETRFLFMMGGPLLSCLLFSGWVLFASRLRWREKLGIASAGVLCPVIAFFISASEPALKTTLFIYGVPLAIFMVTGTLTYFWRRQQRALFAIVFLSLGWALFAFLRNDGFDGSYYPEFAWRWSPRYEDTLPLLATPRNMENGDFLPDSQDRYSWPQFRGPDGNGAVAGTNVAPDWAVNPPKELWRIPIGLGWSSFAYEEGRLFTQEQRGEKEYITCYSALNGSLLWSHADESRFAEVVSGAGPRSTPSVFNGFVYTLGGNGLLTCLAAHDGKKIWQRNLVAELNAPIPMWGFSGSPLILGDKLIIYAGAEGENGLIALELQTGKTLWGFPSTDMNYSTARSMTLAEQNCIVFCDSRGVHAISPKDGSVLWTYLPKRWKGPAMVDPQQISPSSLLVSLGDGIGMTRLEVNKKDDRWNIEESWSSRNLRPSFNDSVVLDGNVYGFNRAVFSCMDVTTGERKWQGGRYGFGQAVLLKNCATIIIAAENGDVVLLNAAPERLNEIARIPVLHDKTWNHPIVVGNRLFLRNGKTAVCLQLTP